MLIFKATQVLDKSLNINKQEPRVNQKASGTLVFIVRGVRCRRKKAVLCEIWSIVYSFNP